MSTTEFSVDTEYAEVVRGDDVKNADLTSSADLLYRQVEAIYLHYETESPCMIPTLMWRAVTAGWRLRLGRYR